MPSSTEKEISKIVDYLWDNPKKAKRAIASILRSKSNFFALYNIIRDKKYRVYSSSDTIEEAFFEQKIVLLASSEYKYYNLQDTLLEFIEKPDFIDLVQLFAFEAQAILFEYKNIKFDEYPESNDIVGIRTKKNSHKINIAPGLNSHYTKYSLLSSNSKFINYIGKLLKSNRTILTLHLLNDHGNFERIGDAKLLADKYIEAFILMKRHDILAKYYKLFDTSYLSLEFLRPIVEYFIENNKIDEANDAITKIEALEPTYPYILEAKKKIEGILLIDKMLSTGIDIEHIDKLSGLEFENLLIEQFQKLGYKTIKTPTTGDFGADIIVDTKSETRFIIQCKRFKNKVNLKAVQEVVGALAHFNGDIGIVITSSSFLNSAIKLAESNDIELWDKNKLMKFLSGDVSFSEIDVSNE